MTLALLCNSSILTIPFSVCSDCRIVPHTEHVSRWGIRMLWQSFNLVHTLVLIHTSLSDCCYRTGCTLSYGAPPVTGQWQLRRTATPHAPVSSTHPSASEASTLPPSLPSPPASPNHPHSTPPPPFSFPLSLPHFSSNELQH